MDLFKMQQLYTPNTYLRCKICIHNIYIYNNNNEHPHKQQFISLSNLEFTEI